MVEIGTPEYYSMKMEEKDKAIACLIAENAHLRAALLLIREHKLPYPGFSMLYGSNGVRDYFISVADKALGMLYFT